MDTTVTITLFRWLRRPTCRVVVKRDKLLETDAVNRYEAAISCVNIGNDSTLASISFLALLYPFQFAIFIREKRSLYAIDDQLIPNGG